MNLKNFIFFKKLMALPFVEKIILFGSRARHDAAERSDIDLAIVCPQASDKNWFEIIDIIENADTLLKIDCIRFDTLALHHPLKKSIEQEGIVFYERI